MNHRLLSGFFWRGVGPLLVVQLTSFVSANEVSAQPTATGAPTTTTVAVPPAADSSAAPDVPPATRVETGSTAPAPEPRFLPAPPPSEPSALPVAPAPPPPTAAAPGSSIITIGGNPLKIAETPKTDISGIPGQGLTVKTGDEFSLNIRTRMQARYQVQVSQPNAAGDRTLDQIVNINTARVYLSGNALIPQLTYLFQLAVAGRDYRDGATSPIYDAYVEYKPHRDFNLQAGQFFVPFDRLRTVREWALQLAERPRPVSELTLDRDVGIQLYSDHFLADKSPVGFHLGAFGGGGTNLSLGRKPGALLVGRVELRPLGPIDDDREGDLDRRSTPGLALGAAFAANINTNRARSTTGAAYKSLSTTTNNGRVVDYYHFAADLVFKWQGLAIEAEYLLRNSPQENWTFTDAADKTTPEYTRTAAGWIAQVSYVLPFPLEFVGRLSRMHAIAPSKTDPALVSELNTRGQEIAGGINYYLNNHRFKLQADWIARLTPDFERPEHNIHVQFDATF